MEVRFAKEGLDSSLDAHSHIIAEVFAFKDGYNAVVVDKQAVLGSIVDTFHSEAKGIEVLVLRGDDESGAIYAVATHKTAYEVADELLHDNGIVPDDFSVFDINLAFLQDGDFIQGHIGSELVLQAVDVDELTVEFFFVLMKLKELGGPLHLIEVHTPLQTLGGRSCGVYADACGAGHSH